MRYDIETGLAHFKRVCINIMIENTTPVKPSSSVIEIFIQKLYPIYKDHERIDILLYKRLSTSQESCLPLFIKILTNHLILDRNNVNHYDKYCIISKSNKGVFIMKKTPNKKHQLLLCCAMLVLSMSFLTTGCAGTSKQEPVSTPASETSSKTDVTPETAPDTIPATEIASEIEVTPETDTALNEADHSSDVTVLGEGSISFPFTVVDGEGNTTQFEIHTNEETVGQALLALDLIAGDDSEYGLYVKTVNGITADYDTDGKYWAFYIDDEYATSGVDSTPITDGSSYSFKVE